MPSPTPRNPNTSKLPSSPPPHPPTSPSRVKSPALPVVHHSFPDPSAHHPPIQQHSSQPQPTPTQPTSNSRPLANTATTTTARPPSSNPRPPQSRRGNNSHRASRVGRPPNINENCLMRRLECVMAVESGRMSMLSACQQYDISARTFYRWLRDKHRLIELTGFSEEDFRTNPPWGPLPQQPPASHPQQADENHVHLVHDPQPRAESHDNLPRLSQPSPVVRKQSSNSASVAAVQTAPNGREMPLSYMGMKRRFPKGSDARAQYTTQEERYRGGGGGGSASQAVYYARRSFTKMPSSKNMALQEGAAAVDRNVGRASSRMKRQHEWDQEPEPQFHGEERTYGGIYEESRSDSPAEPYKRRKMIREQVLSGDEAIEVQQEDVRGDAMVDSPAHEVEYTNGSGYGEKLRSHMGGRDVSQQRMAQRSGAHVQTGGRTAVDGIVSDFGKHRIEIMMGRRKVSIAWYEGAQTEDIKAAISRRFALLPGTQWALMDKNLDEVIISPGVPSGRYTLTVFS